MSNLNWTIEHPQLLQPVVGNSVTARPLTKSLRVEEAGQFILIDIIVSGVSGGAGTVKLQDSSDGFTTAGNDVSGKTVTISGNGTFTIKVYATQDEAILPLRNSMRLVATTGAGDAFTVDEIRILQPY